MRTFVKGFLASVFGIALFIAGLIVWLEITGAGYGIFVKESEEDLSSTTAVTTDAVGTGASTGTGAGGYASIDTTTGTGAATGVSYPDLELIAAPESYGYGSWAENGGADGTGTHANGAGGNNAGGNANDANGAGGNNTGGNANGGANNTDGNANGGNNAGGNASSADERTQRFRDFRDQIIRELRAINGENLIVSFDTGTSTVTIAYWDDKLVDDLSRGANVAAIMNQWQAKKDQAQGLSSSYYKRLETYDIDNGHVEVNLLSERDPDREQIILSYVDGYLKHDGLPEDHLRTQRTDPDTSTQ